MKCRVPSIAFSLAAITTIACATPDQSTRTPLPYRLSGPLVPASTTMVTAWDVPDNPLNDHTLDQSKLTREIQWGYKLFTNTPVEAKRFVPGLVSCNNCHLNAGQRERSMPLVAVSGVFPEYNRRAGRLITLADRIVDCFLRSENATGKPGGHGETASKRDMLPTPTSREVLALSAYLTWLSRGYEVGGSPSWRGQNTIASTALIPLDKLSPATGEAIFKDRCTNCHGPDGQGVLIGDKRPAPLWGPNSWNDGAGASRVYTLAGIIRYSMPYMNPGSLSDEEAQQLAAFITSKPRPSFPMKDQDYPVDPVPADAVYYPKRTNAQ